MCPSADLLLVARAPFTKGTIKGGLTDNLSSEVCSAAFLRRRRHSTAKFAEQCAKNGSLPDVTVEACGDAWTDAHQAELDFNAEKLETRRIETHIANGLLVPSSTTFAGRSFEQINMHAQFS